MKIVFSQKQIKIILIISGILLITVIYLLIKIFKEESFTGFLSNREQGGNYVFTNPLLDFEFPQGYKNPILPSEKVRDFVQDIMKVNDVNHISLYYRDLNNGPWIGINEKEYFSPASMLKTPLLIALLKWSEEVPNVLEKEVVVENRYFENTPPQYVKTEGTVEKMKSYSLIDLGIKMIQASDNVATAILYENIPKKYREEVFTSIGVSVVPDGEDVLLRVKDIAGFYRVLFNASYLNRNNSEKALSILSGTFYKEGLVKGLPKDIVTSHKFGERYPLDVLPANSYFQIDEEIQIHDCGIVYYPKAPYILCIMTRGSDLKKQEMSIFEISKFIYNQISR
jgi:beta-lactamase class A